MHHDKFIIVHNNKKESVTKILLIVFKRNYMAIAYGILRATITD